MDHTQPPSDARAKAPANSPASRCPRTSCSRAFVGRSRSTTAGCRHARTFGVPARTERGRPGPSADRDEHYSRSPPRPTRADRARPPIVAAPPNSKNLQQNPEWLWRRGSPSLTFLEEHPCVLKSTINILINNRLLVSRLRLTCHATSPKLVLIWVRVGVRLWQNSRCERSRRPRVPRSSLTSTDCTCGYRRGARSRGSSA